MKCRTMVENNVCWREVNEPREEVPYISLERSIYVENAESPARALISNCHQRTIKIAA